MIPKKWPVKTTGVILVLLSLFAFAAFNPYTKNDRHSTWSHYGGGPDQSKYFDASEITKENVNQLKVAWVYPTMDSAYHGFCL
jgi:quinoprotein glucose dehydrogenase